ncbi:hypothetical protein EMCRGX_G023949 [Ephydatia muelleri]
MAAKNLTFLAKILPRIFCWVAYRPQLQELLHQPGDMTHPRWQGRGEISNVAGLPLFHLSGDFGEAMAFLHTNAQVNKRMKGYQGRMDMWSNLHHLVAIWYSLGSKCRLKPIEEITESQEAA